MAWGKSSAPQPVTTSILRLLPLVLILVLIGGLGYVGYNIYLSVNKMSETASEKMGKKNVVFTKDGVKVGVKQIRNENYVDATQSWVVKAWNLGNAKEGNDKKKNK